MTKTSEAKKEKLLEEFKQALLGDPEFIAALAAYAGKAVENPIIEVEEPGVRLEPVITGFTDEEIAAAKGVPQLGESDRVLHLRTELMEQYENAARPIREEAAQLRAMRLAAQRAEREREE